MSDRSCKYQNGMLVARILAGSWRESQPAELHFTESELDRVGPLLLGCGAAGLGWWRIKSTTLRTTAAGELLQQAYRLQHLHAAIHEQKIAKVFRVFRAARIEPVLLKGWAAAGLYPDRSLRPYGDIDLLVEPKEFRSAEAVLASGELADCWVDLHDELHELNDRQISDVFMRSYLLELDGTAVRVPGSADHFALLAIHLLKHGAWRPLWLCDLAVAIERIGNNIDWDICLGRNPRHANWIISAVGLAEHLLGAGIEQLPFAERARQLPHWLVNSVLKHWERPFAANQPPMSHPRPLASYLKNPSGILAGLKNRWPDPILATVSIDGEFNEFPRLPYQFMNCLTRATGFLFHSQRRS